MRLFYKYKEVHVVQQSKILSQHLSGDTKENNEHLRIACLRAENGTQDLPTSVRIAH
jgi:hypothetical protein